MLAVVLLVHLHILEYPHKDRPEYDHTLFDANVRGLRERTVSMEQIAHFLVGKIEGSPGRAKAILPTYPCSQPSDTLSFRNSFTKYLEALRHAALHPPDDQSKSKAGGSWWWKDVVVRKSILEECAGERFERLIISLSTHALWKCTSTSFIPDFTGKEIPLAIPQAYATLLSGAESKMREWTSSASELLRRHEQLRILRSQIEAGAGPSSYARLSTHRLLAFLETKLIDIQRDHWQGDQGSKALQVFKLYAGFKAISVPNVLAFETSPSQSLETSSVPAPLSPLPIAAAHHPAHLLKLRKRLKLSSTGSSSDNLPELSTSQFASTTRSTHLSNYLEKEKEISRALADALQSCRKTRLELSAKDRREQLQPQEMKLRLWEPPDQDRRINFDTQPTQALLTSFCLAPTNSANDLDHRISHIRRNLPKFPDIPVEDTSLAEIEEEVSSIAIPQRQDQSIKQLDSRISRPTPTDIPRKGNHGSKNTTVTRTTTHDADQTRARVPRRSSIFLGKARQELGTKAARIYDIVDAVRDHDDIDPTDPDQDDVLTPRAKTKGTRLVDGAAPSKRVGQMGKLFARPEFNTASTMSPLSRTLLMMDD